jgi:hypothetical protein
MLKWGRWGICERKGQKAKRGEMGLLIKRIYWIEKIGGRYRKERLWEGVGIEVREGSGRLMDDVNSGGLVDVFREWRVLAVGTINGENFLIVPAGAYSNKTYQL